ncbi:T-complex protein 1 subunit alpha [Eumeta japonica]|uniref:T-complex protein 1 subunit alpha n=1 Tax=Eumeta variegata TaxID=151549 RepID=A0A4C1STN5_EUMVA|nr:T-complex protein 1 subunit alpha [Eumeta japonica]
MKMGVQVLITDPEKLEAIRARELDITKERLQKILATGVNVILCSGGIDDLCLKYFIEAGAMGVRRCKKADLKRIARATGATFLTSLTNMEVHRRVRRRRSFSVDRRTLLPTRWSGLRTTLCSVRRVLEGGRVVPGWRRRAALSIYLENFATAAFAQSLLVIPKTLAVNAARDATDLVAKLRAYHNSSQTKVEHVNLKWVGLDLVEGSLRDNLTAGVLEPAISKIKSLKFATEAAITILRIDDMIKLDPEQKGRNYDECNGDFD